MNKEMRQEVVGNAEAEELRDFIRQIGEEKGIDNFFLEIIRNKDNLKIGNLTSDEIGLPELPLRTIVQLSHDCEDIPSMEAFVGDFRQQASDMIATSLSKEGFLIKSRITQKKELLGTDKRKTKSKRGLFGIKEEED